MVVNVALRRVLVYGQQLALVVEVPLGGDPIKYELDKASGTLFVDRFLYTAMRYPGNYGFVPHTLSPDGNNVLDAVTLERKRKTLERQKSTALNTTNMGHGELLKAACCNIAESFETNPSIDVNFSDALTGSRQIKMLGLTSPYLLIAEENIPAVRGASQAFS